MEKRRQPTGRELDNMMVGPQDQAGEKTSQRMAEIGAWLNLAEVPSLKEARPRVVPQQH